MLPFETIRPGGRATKTDAPSGSFRPHSRQPHESTAGTPMGGSRLAAVRSLSPHQTSSHSAAPSPTAAQHNRAVMLPNTPSKLRFRGAPPGPRPGFSPSRTSPNRSRNEHITSPEKPPLLKASLSNDVPAESGATVKELLSDHEVQLNYKRFDLSRDLPQHRFDTCVFPKFQIGVPDSVVYLKLNARSTSPKKNANRVDPSKADDLSVFGSKALFTVSESGEEITIPGFAKFIVDSDEVDLDRALEYHTFVEVPDMFLTLPHIASDGTLTFALNLGYTGASSLAWARLADNACVSRETGEIATSEPLPFLFSIVGRDQSCGQGRISKAIDWKSFKHKMTAETAQLTNVDKGTPAIQEAGPHEATLYQFPNFNIHALRDTNACNDSPLYSQKLSSPYFSSPVCDLERLRVVHWMQERDRFVGETPENFQQAATLEQRLNDRISKEQQENGHESMMLCPLLTRLAQIKVSKGAAGQGDAIELFDRVVRIRQKALGMSTMNDTASIFRTAGINEHAFLQERKRAQTEEEGGNSALPNELAKHTEEYVQSLTITGTFLKHIARFEECKEYLVAAVKVSEKVLGPDSVHYIRAFAQVAETHYLQGEFTEAVSMYEKSLTICEVLFGDDASSTSGVRHLLGIALLAKGDINGAIKQHEAALQQREDTFRALEARLDAGGDSDTEEETKNEAKGLAAAAFSVLESLTYLCRAWARGKFYDQCLQLVDQAVSLMSKFDTSMSAEYTIALAAINAIAAFACAPKAPEKALSLITSALQDVAGVRGPDSTEAAIFRAERGVLLATVGQFDEAKRELEASASAFASAVGKKHPYSARVSATLAAIHLTLRSPSTAFPLAEHAHSALMASLRPSHRDLGSTSELLGLSLLGTRDNHRAFQLLNDSFMIAKQAKLAEREQRLLTSLTAVYCRLGRAMPTETIVRLEEVLARVKNAVGEASTQCLVPLQNLAEAYYLCGNFEQAHHTLSKALKLADSLNMIFLLGPLFKPAAQLTPTDLNERNRLAASRINSSISTHFAEVLFSIACVFEAQGRLQEAQSTALQVLAALELANQPTSIRTAETLRLLAVLLFKDGHYGDALAYAEKGLALLLEHHQKATDYVHMAFACIDVIDKQLQANGYTLVRHQESRYRFSVFL